MTSEMNWSNNESGHVKPICFFDLCIDKVLQGAFNWINTQLLSTQVHQQEGTKLIFLKF